MNLSTQYPVRLALPSRPTDRLQTSAWLALAAALASLVCGPVQAHAVSHRVEQAAVVLVSLDSGPEQPLTDAPYRVFGPEPGPAYSVGRTDTRGQLTFQPDQAGTWRVIVSSADGHGASLTVEVDESLQVPGGSSNGPARWPMVLAGLGYITGLAGLALLWKRRSLGARP